METITKKASLSLIELQSGGDESLFCRLYSPALTRPAPLIVLFHGFPGKQLNMDWAVRLQELGFHVLVTSYRGTIGSPGAFRFRHTLEDATAIMKHVASPAFTAQHDVAADQITIVGHSMGGFAGLHAFANVPTIAHYIGISPFNFGLIGQLVLEYPEHEEALRGVLSRGATFLSHTDGDTLLKELTEHHAEWNLLALKEQLRTRSALLVTSERDETSIKSLHHDLLQDASTFEEIIVDSDHNYIDNREDAFQSWTTWLQQR